MRRFDFDQTDSTNSQARRLAALHPGEPLLVTAAVQTEGRGREGRRWQSPRGGAWLSVAWPLPGPVGADHPLAGDPPLAPLAAAVAMRRALCDVAHEVRPDLQIKWPNDLLIAERKVAGILCELLTGDGSSRTLVVGVGVNVEFDPSELVAPLRRPATSLYAAIGRHVTVDEVLNAAETRLGETLGQAQRGERNAIVAELAEHLALVGRTASFQVGAELRTGVIRGVDEVGRLILDGAERQWLLSSGEMDEPSP